MSNLKEWARIGAQARLRELQAEVENIRKTFPELRDEPVAAATSSPKRGAKRAGMSAAKRKQISERMKAYWATRRAGSKK